MTDARLIALSESGFTWAYAQWVSQELGVSAERLDGLHRPDVAGCRVLILGAPVHGGELLGARRVRLMAREALASGARVLLFATGVTPASERYARRVLEASGLADDEVSFFYLPGGFDRSRLGEGSKTLLFLYRTMMRRQGGRSDDVEAQLERTETTCDFTDRSLIGSLVEEAKSALAA